MFKPVEQKQSLAEMEHEMLDFWEKNKIFEKSVKQREDKEKYVFFDGPPFANGLPHYGHILANALKDAVTRYWTMKGFYVPRVNGWDCHGLPVEYEVEKDLKLSGRKDILDMGVEKFNSTCRKSVFKYTEEWEKLLKRIGRWVDFENSYATLENEYIESIWWVFKQIWNKDMIYEGLKSMHICPRCETPLSNFEVGQGYKNVTDFFVTVKFQTLDDPKTFFLAWTTTPWALPGQIGLVAHPNLNYQKVRVGEKLYWCVETRVKEIFKDMEYEVVENKKGSELEGMSYVPLFSYNESKKKESKNAFTILNDDYVSDEDGTGFVTTSPDFGEDDMRICKKYDIPFTETIDMSGRFREHVIDFAGLEVKPQKDFRLTDQKIVDHLDKAEKLLDKGNYKHSYPHCWRCDTPLLNYATSSWFIKVTDIKDKLVRNNKKIHWQPPHIQTGRFGKWLEGVRDWAISRNRFWGCPMPIWKCECGEKLCIDSIKELREYAHNGNRYLFVRHGEAKNNVEKIINSNPKNIFHLTSKGKKQAEKIAKKLKAEGVDLFFASPFARAKETAEIINEMAFQGSQEIVFDQHLVEHQVGDFDGENIKKYIESFETIQDRFEKRLPKTESFKDVEKRIADFINYLDRKYEGKTILIVTHGDIIRAAQKHLENISIEKIFDSVPETGSITEIKSGKLPMRDDKLDLHKPYIDEIKLKCNKCGSEMTRISDVLDCWFESGSMPYAQLHYPFENKKEFEDNFPANFIAEGLDQTRGWFYTLHVLSTILFDKPAFQNVIVNGTLLAADGEKLSKRKKNYPDPNELFEKHGVDSTRFFLYSSTASLAEDVRFSENSVEEIVKKYTLTIWNTYSFFITYANIDNWKPDPKAKPPENKLDQWILSEMHELINEVTMYMDDYDLTNATRPLMNFVDNLSNWYVRRSRRRFWKSENDNDKNQAYQTLYTVLINFSKITAPFTPFLSEAIYKNLTDEESVHLQDWPNFERRSIKTGLNSEVRLIRKLVTLGHAVRAKKNIKVRQPLALIQIALPSDLSKETIKEYESVILEELNVKKLEFVEEAGELARSVFTPDARALGPKYGKDVQQIIQKAKAGEYEILDNGKIKIGEFEILESEGTLGFEGKEGFDVESEGGIVVALDTAITDALKEEGYAREIIRHLQEMRKQANYNVSDRIYVYVKASEKSMEQAVTSHADFIRKETLATELQEAGDFQWDIEKEIDLDDKKVTLAVRK